jgi:hypothetical protein
MDHNFKISIKASDGEVMATVDATVTAENTIGAFTALNEIIKAEIKSFSECTDVSITITRAAEIKSFSEIVQKYKKPPVEDPVDESSACDPLSHNADALSSGKCSTCGQANIL